MELLSIVSSTILNQIINNILRLPRELRDLICAHVVTTDRSINFIETSIQLNVKNEVIRQELWEAIYTHNTISLDFSDVQQLKHGHVRDNWGPHPQLRHCIRKLEVYALESPLHETDLELLEHKCTSLQPSARAEWAEILELPRLENLSIYLQKQHASRLSWANFSPVAYELRASRPNITVSFNVSYDQLLKQFWDSDPAPGQSDYEYMNFVDVSDLLEPPSEEDREYKEKYWQDNAPIIGRDAMAGLLSENASNKRILAKHYVVIEPSFLRVAMAEHYEIYKKAQAGEQQSMG